MSASASSLPTWLFVSYGGGHVKALLPVARRVLESGIARPVYLALTTAADAVRAAGIPVLGFRNFWQPGDERARAHGERLAAQLQVAAADPEESIAYLGLSYADLEDRLGTEAAAAAYAQYGRQAFLPLGVLQRVLRKVQPALVMASNSPRAERAALETARAIGVPSVCLLDLFGIADRNVLARPGYGDVLCVLNEEVRAFMVEGGRPAAEVRVTGNPAFDSINAPEVRALGRKLRSDAGWDALQVCLYASSPEPERYPGFDARGDTALPRRIEQMLVQAVDANPRLALWVRRHPSEAPPDEIAALRHPRIRASTHDMPLHACLHASDEIVVTVSTVGLEAALAGKAVTQVHGSMFDELSPYLRMGVARRELTLDALARGFEPLPAGTGAAAGAQAAGSATGNVLAVLQSVHAHGR